MYKSSLMVFAALFLSGLALVEGYKILCVLPVPSRSHHLLGEGLVKILLRAGHEVTWVTSFPENRKWENLTLIDVSQTHELVQNMGVTDDRLQDITKVKEFGLNVSLIVLHNEKLRHALAYERFDAVLTEWFFNDVYAGFAAVQQVPWIMFSSITMHPHLEFLVDEMRSFTTIPMMMTTYPIPMNFFQRVANSFIAGITYLSTSFSLPATSILYSKMFSPLAEKRGVKLPPIEEAQHNISMVLVNSHPPFSPAQTLPANAIEIAGYHIAENVKPLPKDLQELLDNSPQGVIYFSMGSIVKSSALPERVKQDLIKIFSKLPQTVLWKFEVQLQGLPKNVHIRPWLPQASILAHPNVKLFFSHGGLLSGMEALQFSVPMLAVPIFGDQPNTAARAVAAGYALKVDYSEDMGPEIEKAIHIMLKNDSFATRVKGLSVQWKSRPIPPSHLVAHYVELAIKTKGAPHLRSKAQLYKWYQRWMIDQLLLLLFVLYSLYFVLTIVLRKATNVLLPVRGEKKIKYN